MLELIRVGRWVRQRPFVSLNLLWGLFWLLVLAVFHYSDSPLGLFVIPAMIVGLAGHAYILLLGSFKHLGDWMYARRYGPRPSPWPWPVVAIIVLLALTLLFLARPLILFGLTRADELLAGDVSITRFSTEFAYLLFPLLIAAIHLSVLLALLMRLMLSRWLLTVYGGYWFYHVVDYYYVAWEHGRLVTSLQSTLHESLIVVATSAVILGVVWRSEGAHRFFRPLRIAPQPR